MVSSPIHERNPRFTEKPSTSPLHQQRERVREAWRRPKAKVSQHRQYLDAKAMIKKVPEDWQQNQKMSMPHIHERQHFVSQLQPDPVFPNIWQFPDGRVKLRAKMTEDPYTGIEEDDAEWFITDWYPAIGETRADWLEACQRAGAFNDYGDP